MYTHINLYLYVSVYPYIYVYSYMSCTTLKALTLSGKQPTHPLCQYMHVLCICMYMYYVYVCIYEYICINVYTRRSVSVCKCISIYLSIFVHVMHKLESSDTVRAACKTQAPPLCLSRSLSPDSLCCGSGSQLT